MSFETMRVVIVSREVGRILAFFGDNFSNRSAG